MDYAPPGILEENGIWYLPSALKHGYGPPDAETVFDRPYRGPEPEPSKRTPGELAWWVEGYSIERFERLEVGYEYRTEGQRVVFHIDRARRRRRVRGATGKKRSW